MPNIDIGGYTIYNLSDSQVEVIRQRVEEQLTAGHGGFVRLGPGQRAHAYVMIWVDRATPFSITYEDVPSWDDPDLW